jgi:hypothetical protein
MHASVKACQARRAVPSGARIAGKDSAGTARAGTAGARNG